VLVVTVAVAADDRTSAALDALAGLAARLAGARQER
jgi:hypothetical protein